MKFRQLLPILATIALLPAAGHTVNAGETMSTKTQIAEISNTGSAMNQLQRLRDSVKPDYYQALRRQVAHSELKGVKG